MKITSVTVSGLALLLAGAEAKFPTSLFGKTICATHYATTPVQSVSTHHTKTTETVIVTGPWSTVVATVVVHPTSTDVRGATIDIKTTDRETSYQTLHSTSVLNHTATVCRACRCLLDQPADVLHRLTTP